MKEEERLSDGGGGESESVLAGMEQVTPAAQGEFLAIPRPSDSDRHTTRERLSGSGSMGQGIERVVVCTGCVRSRGA